MLHVIPSHQGRPSDDPIFALNKDATFSMFDAKGDLDALALDRALGKQLDEQKRALVFLNDPCHNPTGYSMRASEWSAVVERLLAHASKAPVTLLVDTAYFAYAA